MKTLVDRRHVLRVGAAWSATAWLPAVRACEFFTPNLKIVHPWSRATGDDATSVAVCMTFDEVHASDRLVGAASPVCTGAEMGGDEAKPFVDFLVPEGQTTLLSESGTYLKLMGLQFALPAGREYPLTLVFEKAGPVSAKLSIDYKRFG